MSAAILYAVVACGQRAEAYDAWNTFKVAPWLSKANLHLHISTNYRKEN